MVFKNFRFQVIIRVLALTLVVALLAWCIVNAFYLRSIYLGAAVVILTTEFIWYIDRFNRDVKSFMMSLLHRDFTTHFQPDRKSRTFSELYDTLNRISDAFKTISKEKEVQYRFLEMLVEHIRVGILTIGEDGKILLANRAVKELLHKVVLLNLKSLESTDPAFVHALTEIRSGETRLVRIQVQHELLQLSIHASEFRLDGKYHKLVSMQNIRNELDNREMEAWQKLIRVLTHEIMNSVSPVISLSETMHGLLHNHKPQLTQADPILYETLDKGLDAVKIRSQGLYRFTQSYRKLTGIPRLSLQETSIGDIIDRVSVLVGNKMQEKGISYTVTHSGFTVLVDPELMEHVLINLLLNAVDAVADTRDPRIEISTSRDQKGCVSISITDNGEGIDEATAEKIFIPFFTTRKDGSGIGLALTKQILQLHRADIRFTSEKGKGTAFVIVL